MKSPFNIFDVVKFASTASINTENQHAKDYVGIVREVADNSCYVEWYDCKSKTATREVSQLMGWINNTDISFFGSLYHLLTSKANAVVKMVTPKAKAVTDTTAEPKQKRKYTRKPGAAKPGPKPKKQVIEKPVKEKKMTKAEIRETEKQAELSKGNMAVPLPLGKYGREITPDWIKQRNRYTFATGKFKHFITRDIIERSINDNCYLYKKMNYNLDFVIVGEKPGPSKIDRLKYLGIPMITEEQWLALIGAPGYAFDMNNKVSAIYH